MQHPFTSKLSKSFIIFKICRKSFTSIIHTIMWVNFGKFGNDLICLLPLYQFSWIFLLSYLSDADCWYPVCLMADRHNDWPKNDIRDQIIISEVRGVLILNWWTDRGKLMILESLSRQKSLKKKCKVILITQVCFMPLLLFINLLQQLQCTRQRHNSSR